MAKRSGLDIGGRRLEGQRRQSYGLISSSVSSYSDSLHFQFHAPLVPVFRLVTVRQLPYHNIMMVFGRSVLRYYIRGKKNDKWSRSRSVTCTSRSVSIRDFCLHSVPTFVTANDFRSSILIGTVGMGWTGDVNRGVFSRQYVLAYAFD